jgi:hypothetical protein
VTDDIGNRGRSLEVVVFWPSRDRLLKGSTGFLRRQVRSSLLHEAGQRKVVARCRETRSISRRIARCDIYLYLHRRPDRRRGWGSDCPCPAPLSLAPSPPDAV